MIEAVIISQGDELTTGQVTDTNSNWIAGKLWEIGVRTRLVLTIPDHRADLIAGLQHAAAQAPIVICTGGLGPTRDDLTGEAVAVAFARPLGMRPEALAQIQARYAAWGREMNPTNTKQAMLPDGAEILENRRGTAPGFAVEVTNGGWLYCLPGVPHEMKAMLVEWVLPHVQQCHQLTPAISRQIGVVLSESLLEATLQQIDLAGAEVGFRAAATGNLVKLRFPAAATMETVNSVTHAVRNALGDAAFGDGEADIAMAVGEVLRRRGERLAVAESCTGGQLLARLVMVEGCSAYLDEGVVVYSNTAKSRQCGVPDVLMETHGAVSEAVAMAMAEGIRRRAGSAWGIGISGIAGPSGGRPGKPVGTVHIAVVGPHGATHHQTRVVGDRRQYIARVTTRALLTLYQAICSAQT